jgi:hypothetical protein
MTSRELVAKSSREVTGVVEMTSDGALILHVQGRDVSRQDAPAVHPSAGSPQSVTVSRIPVWRYPHPTSSNHPLARSGLTYVGTFTGPVRQKWEASCRRHDRPLWSWRRYLPLRWS